MKDWQDKVVEILYAESKDLISLARLAGADPADFYLGADLTGIDLSPAEVAAIRKGQVSAEEALPRDDDEQAEPESLRDDAVREAPASRKGAVAFNIGARRTQVGRPGVGMVIDEPTIVVRPPRGALLVGNAAAARMDVDSEGLRVSWPFHEDKIAETVAATALIKQFARRAGGARALGGQDILFCLPVTATGHERRVIHETCRKAGLNKVGFVDAPLAAAVGAGIPIDTPRAAMVLVVGDSLAEVEVISLSGCVYARAVRAGVAVMDQLISDHLRRRYDVLIGETTAGRVREAIGSASRGAGDSLTLEVAGRSLLTGKPRSVRLTSDEITAALAPAVDDIVDVVRTAMAATPAELSIDISESGFLLAGPGASLEGLARELSMRCGLPVQTPPEPHLIIIEGCTRILSDSNWLSNPAVSI